MTDETADVYLSRARLLFDLERWQEANGELEAALAMAPADPDVLSLMALCQLNLGNSERAAQCAAVATSVAPGHEDALITRAWVLASAGDPGPAIGYAEELQREFGGSAYATLIAAALLGVVSGGQPALDAAWTAVRLAPADPDAHWVLSRIAHRMDLVEVERNAADQARGLQPFPRQRAGVWKLWWARYGGIADAQPRSSAWQEWLPIIKIAAVVVAIFLALAWLAK
ncbi:tetratricopeptide repeat protein [Longispora albida]|uniref:tetratricopeptide repeat protein n=1 Tax=Longispora albida TaxID=203523 RepID=UPI00039A35AA|nr:tetratricopeptide repeat protein [Longispora albida]